MPVRNHSHMLPTLRPHIRPPSLGAGRGTESYGQERSRPAGEQHGVRREQKAGATQQRQNIAGNHGEVKAGAEAS